MTYLEMWESLKGFDVLRDYGTMLISDIGRIEDCLARARDGCEEVEETKTLSVTYVRCQLDQAQRAADGCLRDLRAFVLKLVEYLPAR